MASSSDSQSDCTLIIENNCGQSPPVETTTPPSDGYSTIHTDDDDDEEQEPCQVNLQEPCFLENTWDIYFDDGSNRALSYEDYQHSLVTIGNFSTVQEFWRYWGSLSLDSLPKYCNFRFFKHGVEPSWEDPKNADGGKWSISHSAQNRVMIWREIVFALIGEQFIRSEDMCGLVLSVRSRGDSVHLWNACPLSSDEIAAVSQQLRTILSLSESTPIEYQRHCDAISQSDESNKRKKMAHSPKSRKVPNSPHSPSTSPSPNSRRNGKSNRSPRKPNSRQASLDVDNNFDAVSKDLAVSSESHFEVVDVVIMDIPSNTNGTLQEPVPPRQRRKHSKQQPPPSPIADRQHSQPQSQPQKSSEPEQFEHKDTQPEIQYRSDALWNGAESQSSKDGELHSISLDGLAPPDETTTHVTPPPDPIPYCRSPPTDISFGVLTVCPATIAPTTTPILAPPCPLLEQEQQAQQDPSVSEQPKTNTEEAERCVKRKHRKLAPSKGSDIPSPQPVATAPRPKSTRRLISKSCPTVGLFHFAITAIFVLMLMLYIIRRSGFLDL